MAAEGSIGWVDIMADDFTATASTRALLAQADSHLAQVRPYHGTRAVLLRPTTHKALLLVVSELWMLW